MLQRNINPPQKREIVPRRPGAQLCANQTILKGKYILVFEKGVSLINTDAHNK